VIHEFDLGVQIPLPKYHAFFDQIILAQIKKGNVSKFAKKMKIFSKNIPQDRGLW